MKVETREFERALTLVAATKAPEVALELKNQTLHLVGIGSGSELMVLVPIPVFYAEKGGWSGTIKVATHIAANLVRQIRDDTVEIAFKENLLGFKTPQISAHVVAVICDWSELEHFAPEDDSYSLEMGEAFSSDVNRILHVVRAADIDPRRECISIETSDSPADGFRLTAVSSPRFAIYGEVHSPTHQLVVMGRQLAKACSLLETPPTITVPTNKSSVLLSDKKGTIFVVPCVGGSYYNMTSFVNDFSEVIRVSLKRAEMLRAINVLTLMESPTKKLIVELEVVSDSKVLMHCDGTYGHSSVQIVCAVTSNEPINGHFKIGFNATYLKEACEAQESDFILSFEGPLRFGYFHNENETIREYVLPVRLE